jgi:hypothetical protein
MPVRAVVARGCVSPARRRGRRACRSHRSCRLALAGALTAALLAASASPAHAPASSTSTTSTFTASADAAVNKTEPRAHRGRQRWLWVGGAGEWRSYVRFRIHGLTGKVRQATLLLHTQHSPRLRLEVRVALRRRDGWRERDIRRATAPRVGAVAAAWHRSRRAARTLAVDVTRAVRRNRVLDLVLTGTSRRPLRMFSREAGTGAPRLRVEVKPRPRRARRRPPAPGPSAPRPVAPSAGAARPDVPGSAAPQTAVPAVGGVEPLSPGPTPIADDAVLITAAEIAAGPMTGPAWIALKASADAPPGPAAIADQDSNHDVATLAAALVAARTGLSEYFAKAQAGIAAAIGTESGGRVLALARNLASYVIAADVIDLRATDPALDARFRSWLAAVRTEVLAGETLVSVHETQATNWGTMAGASRAAADAYLGDTTDLDRTATVFRGWLGDRSAYAGFVYDNDLSWQADPSAPVGVNPPGAVVGGLLVDGATPEDMRRGCPLTVPPCHTIYAWEGLQGALVQAAILSRHGYDAWNWGDRGLLRASSFLARLDAAYGGWWATGDDSWQPWLINHVYGTSFPATAPAEPGKVMGWTDWLYGG